MQTTVQNKRIEMLLEHLKKEPNDSFLNYALAVEYGSLNKNEEAIDLIKNLLEKNPDYLGAYYQLGQLFEKTNNIENAVATYKIGRTLAKTQDNKKAYGELTEALMMLEDIDE
ncbi:MAG: tetratricopeptide repeat protein [Bacteroidota bacterium]